MKLYYRAVTQDGKQMKGMIDARDQHEAASYLRQHKLFPIKINQVTNTGWKRFFPFLNKVSTSEKVFFTRQISSMLASGLTLMQSLEIVKKQSQSTSMTEMIERIIADVQNGKSFSQALEKQQNTFSPIYIGLVKTAESSGLMDKTMSRLADNLEKQQELSRSIKNALMYPIIVVVMMVLVVIVMMVFVIPQLTGLYDNLALSLPLTTRIVIGSSNFFAKYWLFGILTSVIGYYYFKQWYKGESGRKIVDGYVLKLPVFGKLISQVIMVELTRTLGLLVGAGSLVVESLMRSSEVTDNYIYSQAVVLVARRVEKGITMGDAMEASEIFPPLVIEMVKIGEQTGKLDESLLKASEYYEREVDQTVKTLSTLLEPIIMVILALGVGFLIFSIITPIYNLITSIK